MYRSLLVGLVRALRNVLGYLGAFLLAFFAFLGALLYRSLVSLLQVYSCNAILVCIYLRVSRPLTRPCAPCAPARASVRLCAFLYALLVRCGFATSCLVRCGSSWFAALGALGCPVRFWLRSWRLPLLAPRFALGCIFGRASTALS